MNYENINLKYYTVTYTAHCREYVLARKSNAFLEEGPKAQRRGIEQATLPIHILIKILFYAV